MPSPIVTAPRICPPEVYKVATAVTRAEALPSIYQAALDAICTCLNADRAAVLFSNGDGVLRFQAWRGLSAEYRQTVEGHSPWQPGDLEPRTVCMEDVGVVALDERLRTVIQREGIHALAFIPLTIERRLAGKLMVYYNTPHTFTAEEIELAQTIAGHIAFAISRQKAEEVLRQSEERFRLLVEQASDGIFVCDPQGHYVDVNSAGCRMLGYSREEVLQRGIADVVAPNEIPRIAPEVARFAGGHVVRSEWQFRRKDGSYFIGEVVGRQLPDGRLQGIARDITERKRAEDQLREQTQLALLRAEAIEALQRPGPMATLLQNVASLLVQRLGAAFARVWTLDASSQTLELQASAGLYTHLDGAHSRVPVGQLKIGRIAQNRQPLVTNQMIGDPQVPEQDWARREGLVAFAGFPLVLEDRLLGVVALFARHELSPAAIETFGALAGTLAQALGRKQAEEAVLAQNQRLNFLNQAAFILLLDSPETVLQRLYAEFAGFFHADAYFEFLSDETGKHLRLNACSGVDDKTIQQLTRLEFGQAICGTVAANKEPYHAHHIQQSNDPKVQLAKRLGFRCYACNPLMIGDRLRGTLSFGSRLRDEFTREELTFFQTISRFMALARERAMLAAQLRQHATHLENTVAERTARLQETVAELEHFSYTITHDMRAPLRAMQAFGSMLLDQCSDCLDPTRRDFLRRIVEAAARMDRLVVDALDYSKLVRQAMPLKPVDTESLIRGIIESYPQLQAPHAHIRIDRSLPMLQANEAALTQCFSNLLSNAIKFVAPGTYPEVRVWAEPRGDWVRVWVEDNGIGIREEHQERVFGMFQRIDTSYDGTGIGLALVKKAVERMGGKVGVESEPDKGARFWVELKCAVNR